VNAASGKGLELHAGVPRHERLVSTQSLDERLAEATAKQACGRRDFEFTGIRACGIAEPRGLLTSTIRRQAS